MAAMIKTKNLSKQYQDFKALKNVSMTVEKGQIYGFVGKNGAGKTTFFKCLMGLTTSTSGEIKINGSKKVEGERKNIGFMIGSAFFPYFTARQNIEYYRKLKGITDKKETERVLKLVNLDKEKKPFKSFSMGMKQRVGIANALLGQPDLVILDEPLNGLDPQGITDIRHIIQDVNETYGTTFIISSHILSELDLVATHFGFIDGGVLLKEISHQELHQLMAKTLVLEVDDTEKALQILKQEFQVPTTEIGEHGEIILDAQNMDTSKISKAIVNSQLELRAIYKKEMTLENYYFNLINHKEGARADV